MILSGYFTSIKRHNEPPHVYTVTITTDTDLEQARYIIDTTDSFDRYNDEVIMFAAQPVKIDFDFEDTFEHIITRSATLNLVTNFDITPMLAASTRRDIGLSITEGDVCLFKGYIEPISWDQPFVRTFNTVSLEATDVLCGLQYIKYIKIPEVALIINENSTFENIISTCFEQIGITGWTAADANVSNEVKTVLEECMVVNSLFGGTSEDKWLSCYDVLNEIGKYLNIYFMFNDETIDVFDWHHLPETQQDYTFTRQDIAGADTTLSTSDVYSKIKLECDIETTSELFNLFDGDTLTNPFTNCQKCLTEIISEGEGDRAWEGFKYLCTKNATGTPSHGSWWKDSYLYDHYFRVKKSKMFPDMKYNHFGNFDIDDGVNQHKILQQMASDPGGAAFISFGKTEKISETDDKPVKLPSMKDYLVISVRGQGNFSSAGATAIATQIESNSPIMSTTINGATLIPSDADTTNYILISGHIYLNPVQPLTGTHNTDNYTKAYQNTYFDFLDLINLRNGYTKNDVKKCKKNGTIEVGNNGDGAFYTHRYWTTPIPNDIINNTPYSESGTQIILPDLKNDKNSKLKYSRSFLGLGSSQPDNISKLPLIACRMKIGDKYCWEDIEDGMYGSFSWVTLEDYNTAINKPNNTEPPVFTIGGNPAIDDYFIGGSGFDICDNVTAEMNLGSAKGTAIPIRMSDNLTGEMTFEILGPYNLSFELFDDGTINVEAKDLAEFWKTGQDKIPVMQAVDSIMISDFKIEAKSDNGGTDKDFRNNDLVYVSESTELDYADEKKDEVIISTMLTSDEADEGRFDIELSNSHPIHFVGATGTSGVTGTFEPFYGYENTEVVDGITGIYYVKPEELYVSDYFDEYYKPRTVIDTTVKLKQEYILNPLNFNISTEYKEGTYKILTYSADLKRNMINLKMKNMEQE